MFDLFNKDKKKYSHELPSRSYTVDSRSIQKLNQKELITLATQQQKYIKDVVKRFEGLRDDHLKLSEKNDELSEKNQIIDSQIVRMSNEHEELSIKFNNLQNALELTLAENQRLNRDSGGTGADNSKLHNAITEELKNLQNNHHAKFEASWDSEKNLASVFEFYRNKLGLMEKIEMQNRKLKEKLEDVDNFKGQKGGVDTKELERKESQILNLSRQLHEATSRVQTFRVDLTNKDKLLASKTHQLQTLTLQLKDRRHTQSKLQSLNHQLTQSNHIKQKQLSSVSAQLSQADSSKQKAFSLLQADINRLGSEKQQAVRNLTAQINEMKMQSDMARAVMNSEMVGLRAEKERREREIEELKAAKEGLLQQVNQAKERRKEAVDQATSQVAALESKIEEVQNDLSKSLKERELIAKELEDFKALVKNTQSQQAEASSHNSAYELEISQLKSKLQELKQSAVDSENQLRVSQAQLKQALAELSNKQEALKTTLKELEQTNKSLAELIDKAEKLEQALQQTQSRQTQKSGRISQLEKIIEQTTSKKDKEISQLSNNLSQKQNELTVFINSTVQTHKDELSNLVATHNKEIQQYKQKLQSAQSKEDDHNHIVNQLQSRIQKLQQSESALQSQLKYKQEQLDTATKDLSQVLNQKSQVQEMSNETKHRASRRLDELQKLNIEQKAKIEEFNENMRRIQNELNQNRIKIESQKKTITKFEQKEKQNRQSMEKIYDELLMKTEKLMQMEEKLKQYKKQIQKQKTEKNQLQQAHEKKIKQISLQMEQAQKNTQSVQQKELTELSEREFELKNRILMLQQQLNVSQQQIEKLHQQIEQIKENGIKNQELVKTLSEKRQQAIKQIQRLEKKVEERGSISMTPTSSSITAPPQIPNDKDKSKKVAQKALRAFGIMQHKLEPLYKQFINHFIDQMQDERIKRLQRSINDLIGKTSDMQDVFKDYL